MATFKTRVECEVGSFIRAEVKSHDPRTLRYVWYSRPPALAPARPPAGRQKRLRLNTIIPVSCRSSPKTAVILNACAVPNLSLGLICRELSAFKGFRRRSKAFYL